ncbi:MAG: cytochrome P450 [Oscillatoriales cyanobacterium RM2_1_1]|nr:cytochrome P450 [Oscillatoriales cyanobacterium SM2_3_0]NJO47406.1 cytochrome P450 [Oscillatoriales cyanobacterium RM2_1_1]
MKLPDGPRLPALVQTLKIIAQPLQFLESCAHQYGDIFTLQVLGINSPPVVFLSHPEAIAAVFTSEGDKFELGQVTHVFRPLTGTRSLIAQDGQRHQRLRQLLMPPLHGKRLPTYGTLIREATLEQTAGWVPGKTIKIRDYTADIALQVILKVVFGLQSGSRYLKFKQLLKPFLDRVNSPFNSLQFFWSPLQQDWGAWSPWGSFLRQQQQIDQLIYAEIAERRQQPIGEDVLSLLIAAQDEAGEGLTDQELRDQLITLLLLGQDTTASALAWAFYWIHRSPRVLARLRQELANLGPDPAPLTLAQLPYLNAVCQETLRIHPIALISQPRVVREPVELEGYCFPPGTILVPCIHLAHRRSQVFPQPEQFEPERFLQSKFSPYEYFPFGGGNRSCIGMALSLFEMKLVLATLLSHYQLELTEGKPVRPTRRGITIVPSEHFELTMIGKGQPQKPTLEHPLKQIR